MIPYDSIAIGMNQKVGKGLKPSVFEMSRYVIDDGFWSQRSRRPSRL